MMALIDKLLQLLNELGITHPFLAYLILGITSFLIVLIVLKWFTSLFKSPRLIAYKTEKGMVQVNQGAISDLVHSICKKDSHISQLKTKIFPKRKLLNIQIRLRIESGSHLKSIEESLQSEIRESLQQSLGIDNIGFIDIIATGIKEAKNIQPSPQDLD